MTLHSAFRAAALGAGLAILAPVVATGLAATQAQAQTLPAPKGAVVLTVTGSIGVTNADGQAQFDIDMIKALPKVSFDTYTIWTEGRQTFTGVELKTVLDLVGAQGSGIDASALNEYLVDIPIEDAVEGGPILAYEQNGTALSVRDKGPLWLVYPYDSRPEYQTEVVYARSIWQMSSMEIRP